MWSGHFAAAPAAVDSGDDDFGDDGDDCDNTVASMPA